MSDPAATVSPMAPEPQHHTLNYTELTVTDLAAAIAFYEAAFGWDLADSTGQRNGCCEMK